jgi:hypothetical protein
MQSLAPSWGCNLPSHPTYEALALPGGLHSWSVFMRSHCFIIAQICFHQFLHISVFFS